MDRRATGIVMASTAVVSSRDTGTDAQATQPAFARATAPGQSRSPQPVAIGSRSERVLSLILTLEALRTAPALLEPRR